jgi:hypothetical protein
MIALRDHRSMNMCEPEMKLGREYGKLSNWKFHELIFHQTFVGRSKQENRLDGLVAREAEMANSYRNLI